MLSPRFVEALDRGGVKTLRGHGDGGGVCWGKVRRVIPCLRFFFQFSVAQPTEMTVDERSLTSFV